MRAWEELVGRPRIRVMRFHVIAPRRPARRTFSSTIWMWTMPLPMELAASCQPFENSKVRVRRMTTRRREKLLTGEGLGRERSRGGKGRRGSKGGGGSDERAVPLAGRTVLRCG